MEYPEGLTEEVVLKAISDAVNVLARGFRFGPHQTEDIRQQGALFALQALAKGKYKRTKGPLVNFLYRHIRNRLINFKRDKYKRTDSPCKICHRSAPGQTSHENGEFCKAYTAWFHRNLAKQALACPIGFGQAPEETERRSSYLPSVELNAANSELVAVVDVKLPVALRATYLQMRAGVAVPKAARATVEAAVLEILGDGGEHD